MSSSPTTPYSANRPHRNSISQAVGGIFQQSANSRTRRLSLDTTNSALNPIFIEGSAISSASPSNNSAVTGGWARSADTHTRRMSFGGTSQFSPFSPTSPFATGFDWSQQLTDRAQARCSHPNPYHRRTMSLANPPVTRPEQKPAQPPAQPPVEPSVAPVSNNIKPEWKRMKPDAFQERILKGDFYMD